MNKKECNYIQINYILAFSLKETEYRKYKFKKLLPNIYNNNRLFNFIH